MTKKLLKPILISLLAMVLHSCSKEPDIREGYVIITSSDWSLMFTDTNLLLKDKVLIAKLDSLDSLAAMGYVHRPDYVPLSVKIYKNPIFGKENSPVLIGGFKDDTVFFGSMSRRLVFTSLKMPCRAFGDSLCALTDELQRAWVKIEVEQAFNDSLRELEENKENKENN